MYCYVYFLTFNNTFTDFRDLINVPSHFLIFYYCSIIYHFPNIFIFFCCMRSNIWMSNHFANYQNSNRSSIIHHYFRFKIYLYCCLKLHVITFENWKYNFKYLNVFSCFNSEWKLNYWYFISLVNHSWPNSNFVHKIKFINFKVDFDFM